LKVEIGDKKQKKQHTTSGFTQAGVYARRQFCVYRPTMSGNVVNRIVIGGNTQVVNQGAINRAPTVRHQIGTWDLSDRHGNPVSEGTYLVRSTLTMTDGTRERVSVVGGYAGALVRRI